MRIPGARAAHLHPALLIPALLIPALVALAPYPSAAAPPAIAHRVLPNGLEVLLLPEPGREIAAVQIWYRVGLPEEDEETEGFAHLLEHLMFTGTAKNSDFRRAVASLGGRASSGPREDLTYFSTEVPSAAIDAVLALEADRMRGLTLSPAMIQESLDLVMDEERAASDHWGQEEVIRLMRQAIFAAHPYGRGGPPSPALATPERCRAFYERFYRPDRACLVVAGGFDSESVIKSITTHFSAIAPGGDPRLPLPQPQDLSDTKRRSTVDAPGPTTSSWIVLGYRTPGADSPDATGAKLIESYLNDRSVADSLTMALTEPGERAAAAGPTARFTELSGAGLLAVMAPLPAGGDADRALDRLAGAISRLFAAPIDPEDFSTLRDRARMAQASSAATVRDRAIAAALAHLRSDVRLHSVGADSVLAAQEASSLERFAVTYLRPDQAVGLRILPTGASPQDQGREP